MKPDDRQRAHLLVVDDNEGNRDMLSRRLGKSGFNVEAVSSGQDALELSSRASSTSCCSTS